MKSHAVVATALAVLCASLAVACKKEDPPPNTANNFNNNPNGTASPYGTQPYGTGTGTSPYGTGTAPAGGTATAPPPATATAPGLPGFPFPFPGMGGGTTGGGSTAANNPGMAVMLQPLLVPLQQQQAPGSHAVGEAAGGMLQEGQAIQVSFTAQPGKCYTGIGVASPPVEILLELATNMAPLPPTVVSQSPQAPVQTVMAGGQQCFKNPSPVPIPGMFRVTAKKGTGMVLAQLYER